MCRPRRSVRAEFVIGFLHTKQYNDSLHSYAWYWQHKAKHLVLLDGGRKYLGGVEELISVAEEVVPYFDRAEDDKVNWVEIARTHCEVRLASVNEGFATESECLSFGRVTNANQVINLRAEMIV